MSSFMQRSYRVGPDGRTAVCDTIAARRDIEALRDAIAWRRNELAVVALQETGTILALRALMTLDDMLEATGVYEDNAPLTFTRDQVRSLCQIAGAYITERDVDGYQAPEERRRLERLRAFAGPLMDCCSELTIAQEQVAERTVSVR